MGVADGSPVVIRAIRPYGVRTQNWTSQKDRTPPVFPAPAPDNADSTLLAKSYTIPLPRPIHGPSPSWSFTLSGQFTYLERTPTDEATGFPGAKMPMVFRDIVTILGPGLGGIGGGGALATLKTPLELMPDYTAANREWFWTSISRGFADPTLSQTWFINSEGARVHNTDNMGRG